MSEVERAFRVSGRFSVKTTAGRWSSTSRCLSSTATVTLYAVEVTYDGRCFGCGDRNPDGLQMRFENTGSEAVCDYELPSRYQGWQGMMHGGMVALMLDEAVGWAGWHSGHPGVTARLEVRYRIPLELGERVRVAGRVDRVKRTLVYASASIDRLRDGARVAEATATLMAIPAVIA
jgi:acyl-coenzyme A thioesterase PaaI-like protein